MGSRVIVGVDEAGIGSLAGPAVVVAAAFNTETVLPRAIRDSKKMRPAPRENVIDAIYDLSEYVVIAEVPVGLINRHINIWCAWDAAMTAVLTECRCRGGQIIVDGIRVVQGFSGGIKYEVKADDTYREVSAASVVAKYVQTCAMEDAHEIWPLYGFDRHHGYGTAEHMRALRAYGPCGAHRIGCKPVKKALAAIKENEPDRVQRLRQLDLEAVLDLQIIG